MMKAGTCKKVKGNKCLCKTTKGGVSFKPMSRCTGKKKKSYSKMRKNSCKTVGVGRRCVCKSKSGKVSFTKSSRCK